MTERAAVAGQIDELHVVLATDGAFEAWYQRALPRVYSYLLSRCGNDRALARGTHPADLHRRDRSAVPL